MFQKMPKTSNGSLTRHEHCVVLVNTTTSSRFLPTILHVSIDDCSCKCCYYNGLANFTIYLNISIHVCLAFVDKCCLVTSYEANGGLKSFLTQQGAVYMNTGGQSVTQQLDIARQVVEGCFYLANQAQVVV